MEKEKILEMSRAENDNADDERVQQLKLKANSMASVFGILLCAIFMLVAFVCDLDEAYAMVASVCFGWRACVNLTNYYYMRKRADLTLGILNAITAGVEIAMLIILMIG